MIGLAEVGDADELAIGRIAPTVIGAGQNGGIALVIAAHLHAAVPAGIKKHMHLAQAVAAQDHRLLAHRGDKEVARVWDLALVSDKEPGAGEHTLQLLAVDLVVDKDLAADLPLRQINETGSVALDSCSHCRFSHGRVLVVPAKEDVIQSTDCSLCRENRKDLANTSGVACGNVSVLWLRSCASGPEIRVTGPKFSAALSGLNWITSSKAGIYFCHGHQPSPV